MSDLLDLLIGPASIWFYLTHITEVEAAVLHLTVWVYGKLERL